MGGDEQLVAALRPGDETAFAWPRQTLGPGARAPGSDRLDAGRLADDADDGRDAPGQTPPVPLFLPRVAVVVVAVHLSEAGLVYDQLAARR